MQKLGSNFIRFVKVEKNCYRVAVLEGELSGALEKVAQLQVEKEKALADLNNIRKTNRTIERSVTHGRIMIFLVVLGESSYCVVYGSLLVYAMEQCGFKFCPRTACCLPWWSCVVLFMHVALTSEHL